MSDTLEQALERRFGVYRSRSDIEMSTDCGAPYFAKDTRNFARQLCLTLCFTPIDSPQYDLLLRWFAGLGIGDPVWVPTVSPRTATGC